ncbi:MAG: tetratricopeptide (TPR) repeat protein [Bacillariaceae sp.]|jgi:tetratricopeptide (TPR) repeat protein
MATPSIAMSLFAIRKGAAKNAVIVRRAQRRCFSTSIDTGRYKNCNGKSRISDSSSLLLNKQQRFFTFKGNTSTSTSSTTISTISTRRTMVGMNYHRDFTHRLSSTTTGGNSNCNDKEKVKVESSNNPQPMPDKDAELRLVDLQATINEAYKRGDFTRALTNSQDLLKQTQQHFGYNVDHPATASAMNNVGLMQKLLGNFIEARQHYVAAMRIYATVCGRDHASYAMTLHNLGNLNKTQVHFDTSLKATERLSLVEAAMDYLEEAYAIRIAELGKIGE